MHVQVKVLKLPKGNQRELIVDYVVHSHIYMIYIFLDTVYSFILFILFYSLILFFIIKTSLQSYATSLMGSMDSNEDLGETSMVEHI